MSTEFRKFPSIPRLNKHAFITEKLDGTNAAVVIDGPYQFGTHVDVPVDLAFGPVSEDGTADEEFVVYAQSRSRVITPGKQTDNHGFAAYVHRYRQQLASVLGPGYHYGEWWGAGINRGYGLTEKYFSLFNPLRYASVDTVQVPNLCVVPTIWEGNFTTKAVEDSMGLLGHLGSFAAPGYMNPEGVVVFHQAAQQLFKVTFDYDEGKWQANR